MAGAPQPPSMIPVGVCGALAIALMRVGLARETRILPTNTGGNVKSHSAHVETALHTNMMHCEVGLQIEQES